MCDGSDGLPLRWWLVEAAADAEVDASVIVYGMLEGMPEGLGDVNRISAEREVGNSLRRTRVSSRWCGGGSCSLDFETAF
jgi:hypothetical protein